MRNKLPCSLLMGTTLGLFNTSALLDSSVVAAAPPTSAAPDPAAPLSDAAAAQLSQGVSRSVIVVMKNQFIGAGAVNDQAQLMHEMTQVKASRVKSYRTLNAFAATVTDAEAERLKANPSVAAVAPDILIRRPQRAQSVQTARASAAASPGANTSLELNVIPGACGAKGAVLLDPEALATTNTDSTNSQALTARSLGITGAGVKVAYIADGVDPNNVNFIRPNGKSAFIDYQDFSGDGPGQVTSGGEAFLDSNAIAGQGIHVYNVKGFSTQADPAACNIRIEGMAPGASLVGLDVFGSFEYTLQSNFLEAIEYAVLNDHVDVLNESFGGNPFPDVTSQDITKLFNEAAVALGTTVTVSSGDAGSANTIGSPATDPQVIDVGASTTFRFYAQTNYAAARYFASNGWLNDNISSLSSGGFSETGATVDLVAPGDLAFASCDASALFQDCVNFVDQGTTPSDVERSGGTSLSAPLTAGAAALVIEAYRNAHHGASPSPALVKQILTSTATDLGVPATEQGAGQLNSYKAVLLAQSIDGGQSKTGGGQTLLLSQNQLNAVDAAGSVASWQVVVTNPGAAGQSVQVSGRTFGSQEHVQSGSVSLLDGVSPQFLDFLGYQNNYQVINFKVPAGADRLNASIAYPGTPSIGLNARVRLILIDPAGRLAAHSVPQGVGNYGNVDVRQPTPGTWTGVIFGIVAASGGTDGKIPWQVSTQRFVPFASVTPSSFFLAPGQSQSLHVSALTPTTPGDLAGSIVLTSSGGGTDPYLGHESNSIPVTLRSLVNLAGGGHFNGVLTGGNGRDPGQGQIEYYEFDVGPGHHSITSNVSLTNDIGDVVGAYLVNPDGVAVGFGQNSLNGVNSPALTAYTLNPVAGRWTLVVDFAEPVVGDELSQNFSGNIQLDNNGVRAPGLPGSAATALAAGQELDIPLFITNTGAAPQQYFVDARLNTPTSITLTPLFPPATSAGYSLPLGSDPTNPNTPEWLVPTQTSKVQVSAAATVPIVFDFSPFPGDPDLLGIPLTANRAAGSYAPAGGTVEQGLWSANPSEIGPYSGPAPSAFVNETMTVISKPFDAAVTSSTGDIWLQAIDPTAPNDPITIYPGETREVIVAITPSGPSGTVVRGTLYVNTVVGDLPPYGTFTADEVAGIPYAYTIQ